MKCEINDKDLTNLLIYYFKYCCLNYFYDLEMICPITDKMVKKFLNTSTFYNINAEKINIENINTIEQLALKMTEQDIWRAQT